MIDINKHSIVNFLDIAEVERAKAKKIYAEDSILLQISATKGQLVYLDKAEIVGSQYAVIQPKTMIYGKYLYYIMEETLPMFLEKYQTGLNIKPEVLKFYMIDIHKDIETQKYITEIMDKMNNLATKEQEFVARLKDIKRYHLENMFC